MFLKFCSGCLLVALTVLPAAVNAQEVMYVTDKLFLGLYDNPEGNGQQFKAVPSGTRLTVVERRGRYALVTNDEGDEGWVKAQFLVSDTPALVEIVQVREEMRKIREDSQDVVGLRERNQTLASDLEAASEQLGAAREQIAALEQQLGEREQAIQDAARAVALAEQQAAEARAALPAPPAMGGEGSESGLTVAGAAGYATALVERLFSANATPAVRFQRYALLAIGAIALLALGFLVGYKWLEHYIRRQHGGYRVW